MNYIKYIILLVCLGTVALLPVSAVSIRSLLGLDEKNTRSEAAPANKDGTQAAQTPTSGASANWAKSSQPGAPARVDLELIKQLLANLNPAQRRALLADKTTFDKFVKQEANNLSVIAAARANKVQQDANTAFLMQRGADNILREIYLNKLINAKLPAGFPSDEQVQTYYDKNQDKLVAAERVHVWQIFLPLGKSADEKAVAALRKQANTIIQEISKGKIDFNSAAVKYSKHAPSNVNGGYMGLIKTADLKPEIRKALMPLEPGKLSRPLKTDTGIHIVKRGAIVPARKLSLEEGRQQIRALLIKQVRVQLLKAVYEQAVKTYPTGLTDNKIEEWRLRLRTRLETPATGKTSKQN